ncbi:MAG: PadR family transcriptional regulator [Candidatus Thorarchaeota archaeon]|nr:PadR family transcriptional regulator [Candidatus Thorarchaeota archaeon]
MLLVRSPVGSRLPFVEVDNKLYLSQERLPADGDLRKLLPTPVLGEWVKYTGHVPRGFLRYKVLALLKERPLSGSEIAKQIEDESGGRWRPSPGSLYPLLKTLLKEGFTEELADLDLTRKYRLTELGRAFLSEQSDMVAKMRERLESGRSLPFLDLPERFRFLPEQMRRAFDAIAQIVEAADEDSGQERAAELAKVMESFVRRLERLAGERKQEGI